MPSSYGPLTLGEIIEKMETISKLPEQSSVADRGGRWVEIDWCGLRPSGINSYRGFYDHLAIGFCQEGQYPRLREFIKILSGCIDRAFTGYKGGEYKMGADTPVWVANYGLSTYWGISDVVDDDGWSVILVTKNFGDHTP